MSTHTCIYNNEDLKNLSCEDKSKLYQALYDFRPNVNEGITTKTDIKKLLRFIYILDCINEKVNNKNKIIMDDIEHDKRVRELLKEYIDTKGKLRKIKEKLEEFRFCYELNPLRYSYQACEEYNDENISVQKLFDKYSDDIFLEIGLGMGDICGTQKIRKIIEIIKKIESEEC